MSFDKTDRILKKERDFNREQRTPIGTDIYLPNYSGATGSKDVKANFSSLIVGNNVLNANLNGNGSVGIGTASPLSQLEIAYSSTADNQLRIDDSTGGDWLGLYSNGDNSFIMDLGGTSAVGTLTIKDLKTTFLRTTAGVVTETRSDGTSGWNAFLEGTTARGYIGFGDAGSIFTNATTDSIGLRAQGDLFLGAGGDNIGLTILSTNRNVGINDIAPAEKLDVDGNINLTGVLKVDDVQVVKEQQAHIADAKADYIAGDLDTEAEIITAINATNAKINAILLMLETHGLVASA